MASKGLEGRSVLCFGHDWSGDPLSKTHIMRLIARKNRVLWINSIGYRKPTASARDMRRVVDKLKKFTERVREVEPNIFVLGPLAIPAYDSPVIQRLNRELLRLQIKAAMKKLHMERPISFVFNPTGSVVTGSLGEDKVVYYCVDEFTAYSDAGTTGLVALEEKLLARADLVVVSAESLRKTKSKYNPRIALVRHGVQFDHFRKALDPATKIPDDVAGLPKPVIGYFGLMADDWIDIDLLDAIAQRFKEGTLVLLGKVTTDMSKVTRHANVKLLGRKRFEDLPAYAKAFDVALNAFPINDVTLNANPLKVREYLAAGLPVVSSRIPEVEVLGDQVHIADDQQGFLDAIAVALKDPGPKLERSETMRDESWAGRYAELEKHLEAHGIV
ncbi:MAG TPA: glycosyltransferase [Polyangiaceae bacterium]|jgi:glycosyltransferase involved in cell wall biosynthesis|nr:glycosyltransferase [Polyangiaceae bacterium]